MKRFVCTILAALTVFTALPLNTLAAETDIIYPAGTVIDDDSGEIVEATQIEWDEPEEDTSLSSGEWTEEDQPVEPEDPVEEEFTLEGESSDEETDPSIRRLDEDAIAEILGEDEISAYDTTAAAVDLDEDEEEDDELEHKDPPARPDATSITKTSITVNAKAGVEYSIDGGQTWVDDGIFENLNPGQEYTIYARYKATEKYDASDLSLPLTVQTVAKDTYIVSNEEELLAAFSEVSTLPATQERINVRFTNDIVVSNTVVLPKLRGRMELYLDLYGFTLQCTRYGVPVVQIETRATLGSSYYLDSGSSTEQLHGGHLKATGDGKAIYITASAVAKLRGLTFTCGDVAIENEGDLALIENVHGGIVNSGYIESINGMKTSNRIVNDGTIEEIVGCTFGSSSGYQTIYRDAYSENLSAPLINRGVIGSITDTKVSSGSMVTILNTSGAVIETMGGNNYFRNSNRGRSTVVLNYGTIENINDGMYIGYRGCVMNYGEISHIAGGLFVQLEETYNHFLDAISESDAAYLEEIGYPQTVIANWGTIPDISGGMYDNNRYSTWGQGNWYIPTYQYDGMSNYGDTWAWERLIQNMTDDASYAYREGYALSRNKKKYSSDNPYDTWSGAYTFYEGYVIDKAYTVTIDTSEVDAVYLLDVNVFSSVKKSTCEETHSRRNRGQRYAIIGYNEDIVAAPTTLAYVAGDSVYRPGHLKIQYGMNAYVECQTMAVRIIDGQLDLGKTYTECEECGLYSAESNARTYTVSSYTCSNEKYNSYTFTMPAENVTFTPNWTFNTRDSYDSQRSYLNYDSLKKVESARWKEPSAICSSAAWKITTHTGDEIDWQGSSSGYSYSLSAYDLQKTQWQSRRTNSSFANPKYCDWQYLFEDRYKYQWSINKEDWYEEEDIPLTTELLETEGVTISKDYSQITIPLYMRKVPIGGGVDDNIAPGKAIQITTIQLNAPYKPFSVENAVTTTYKTLSLNVTTKCRTFLRFILIDVDGTESILPPSQISGMNYSYISPKTDHIQITDMTNRYENFTNKLTFYKLQAGQQIRVEAIYEDIQGSYLGRNSGWLGTELSYTKNHDLNVMYAQPLWQEVTTFARKKSQDAPTAAPTLVERLDTSITVATDENLEFSIDNGSTWQTGGTFSKLNPGTEYTIISRYAETDNSYASSASPGLTVSTRESADILQAPTLVSKTDTSLTVNVSEGFEYSIDGGEHWQERGCFSGLLFGTEYEIVSRKTSEPDYFSPILKVRTAFSAPVLVSRTDTELVIETVDGAEYQISGGSSWQTGGTFGGLSPNTEYTITARKCTEHDSLSDTLTAKTKNVKAAPATAPTLEGKTDTELAVVPEENLEYSIDGGLTWVDDGYFSGLTEDTEYHVISRFPETDDAVASPASPALSVITKFTQTASPVVPKVLNITTNSIQIETVDGQEYALREEDETELVRPWQEEDTFRGLDSETSYEIITRLTETETTAASALCPQIVVVFTKQYVSVGGSSVGESDNKALHTAYIYGYPDGTIHPEESMTRAEAAAMFSTAFALDELVEEVSIFSDVTVNDWYFAQIQQMAKAGYLSGYPDGTFKPEQGMTRAEFVALALKFAGKTAGGDAYSLPLTFNTENRHRHSNKLHVKFKTWLNFRTGIVNSKTQLPTIVQIHLDSVITAGFALQRNKLRWKLNNWDCNCRHLDFTWFIQCSMNIKGMNNSQTFSVTANNLVVITCSD